MNVTTRYLLSQTTRPLVAAMTIGLLVLLAERLVRLLDITLGKKSSFSIVFEMLGYLVPHYLGLALPAAFFIGLLFGFGRLSQDSEINAYQAAGIGLHQLAKPLFMLAVFFIGAAIVIIGFAQPYARYAYRSVVHTVKNVEVFYLAEEGVFMRNGPRTFILQKLARRGSEFEQIFLFTDKGKNGIETITAKNGRLLDVPGRARPVLRLKNGHQLTIAQMPQATARTLPRHTAGTFTQVDTPIGSDAPAFFRPRGHDEREMTLPELIQRLDTPPKWATKAMMRSELHRRLIIILMILILPFLALPFAIGRGRGHRPYRFGVAVIVLIVFHEIFEQGALAVRYENYSPYAALWLPFFIFAAFAGWRFYQVCFSLSNDRFDSIFDYINDFGAWLAAKVLKLRRAG